MKLKKYLMEAGIGGALMSMHKDKIKYASRDELRSAIDGDKSYEIMGEINRKWREWNRKNRKYGFIENDVVVNRMGKGWIRVLFQYRPIDGKLFQKHILKGIKGIKKITFSSKHIDIRTD